MEKNGLNITQKEFKQLSRWAEDAYNIAVVIDYFVSNQSELKECYKSCSGCKALEKNADSLNAFFIKHRGRLRSLKRV